MIEHTPEPWTATADLTTGAFGPSWTIRKDKQIVIASLSGAALHRGATQSAANAARIVACVNACAGMSTEALEKEALRLALIAATEVIEHNNGHAVLKLALAKLRGEDEPCSPSSST